ncbi:MAG: ABC transporter substrate-binding protein [Coriobacteriaceae bacterium]|nr:ABC transporter substrate-binding protein [Coriobacteriaceae bacterium]
MLDRRVFVGSVAGFGAASLAGLLAGCDDRRAAQSSAERAHSSKWVSCRIPEPASIDPLYASCAADLEICSLLFDPLTRINVETGAVEPLACTSFSLADDARSITFRLPQGAVFHNGDPVDAASFKRAWERIAARHVMSALQDDDDPRQAGGTYIYESPFASLLKDIEGYDESRSSDVGGMAGIRCLDDSTLEIRFSRPCANFAAIASHPVLGPVPAYDDGAQSVMMAAPVGNGPFACQTEWNPDDGKKPRHIELTAHKNYSAAPIQIEGATLVVQGDTHAAYKSFQTGDVDVCDVPVEQYREAEKAYGLSEESHAVLAGRRLARAAAPGLVYLEYVSGAKPFTEHDARRAVSLAIDRETLCEKQLRSSYEQATAPKAWPTAELTVWEACVFDPELAAELLEKEYPADKDGARDCSVTLLHRAGGVLGRIASTIAEDLKAVGVQVKIVAAEADEFDERLADDDVSLVLRNWEPAIPDAASATLEFARAGVVHLSGDAQELVDEIRAERDEAKRSSKVSAFWDLLGRDLPIAPVVRPLWCKVVSDRVAGERFDIAGRPRLEALQLV